MSMKETFTNNSYIDDNECSLGTAQCHQFANCTNTIGSYSCDCITGFNGDGLSCTCM